MCDSHRNFDAIIIGQPLTHESMMKIKGKNVLTFTHKNGRYLLRIYFLFISIVIYVKMAKVIYI